MEQKTIPNFVVGIGASAGGLEAIQSFFSAIPPDTGMAFIVVQHLSPNFKSLMDELLLKYTLLPIVTAEEGIIPQPNHIYLNRRDKNLIFDHDSMHLTERDASTGLHLPIDDFFHSLGESYGERAVAVVLSGTGTDGSRGIRTIKEAGGTIMVQAPTSAQFDGMPNATLRTNLPDVVANPMGIAQALIKLTTHEAGGIDLSESGNDALFNAILTEANHGSGIDFSSYKPNTLARRIRKRMDLKGIVRLDDYLAILKGDALECQRLAQEFLIGVTAFFRDTEAYSLIASKIIPELFKRQPENLRIWVAACSSGEEAYSLAILLDEYNRTSNHYVEFKVFATDVDADAVSKAAAGVFPVNILADLSKERVANYFVKNGDSFQIVKRIRERIVFSKHNLLKDPPFIRMDLISCRNLLIYFKAETQSTVLGRLTFALNEGGYLFLGNSESLGSWQDQYRVVDSKWRMYQSQGSSKGKYLGPWGSQTDIRRDSWVMPRHMPQNAQGMLQGNNRRESVYRIISELFAPSCLLFDQAWNVLYLKGSIRNILEFREGEFSSNLLDLIDEYLAGVLRTSIKSCNEQTGSIIITQVPCKTTQGDMVLDVQIRRLPGSDELYLLELPETVPLLGEATQVSTFKLDDQARARINELEQDIQILRSDRQTIVEELETSNEELQSSNEELLASNEELQSTNEELQSVNEELYTVNAELQQRNRELAELYSDLNNLLASTRIATLFLDEELRIRRFTPELAKLFNLNDNDIGRSILNFSGNLVDLVPDAFAASIQKAIHEQTVISSEVMGKQGTHYLQRISPFEQEGRMTGGAVVTFIDITERKRSEQELLAIHSTLKSALIIGNIAWWEWDLKTGKVVFDAKKAEFIGYNPGELEETVESFTDKLHPEDYDMVMENMRAHLEGKSPAYEVEYRIQHKLGHYVWLRDRGTIMSRDADGQPTKLLGAVFDITEHRTIEENLQGHLNERELLMREIHHRVKNNLQKIISILDLQSMSFEDPELKLAFREAEKRIFAMALIHEQLCNNTSDRIDIKTYLEDLVKGIIALNQTNNPPEITLALDLPQLDHEEIIVNGLIINELITNSLKHGCSSSTGCSTINITYRTLGSNYELVFQDSGDGLPLDFELRSATSLGFRIMQALCKQLNGTLVWDSGKGAKFTFTIPLKPGLAS